MAARRKKGFLIVFEGIDGAGKTTQARLLKEKLEKAGVPVEYFSEPSRGKYGRLIRQKALHRNSLTAFEEWALFQKDREENVARNLKPALEKNKVVLLDRYYFSTMAYQGARGIDVRLIQRQNEKFAPRPDLVFILDVPAEKGLGRIQNRKRKEKRFEQKDYLSRVRRIFRCIRGRNIVHLDGAKSREEVARLISQRVFRLLFGQKRGKDLP